MLQRAARPRLRALHGVACPHGVGGAQSAGNDPDSTLGSKLGSPGVAVAIKATRQASATRKTDMQDRTRTNIFWQGNQEGIPSSLSIVKVVAVDDPARVVKGGAGRAQPGTAAVHRVDRDSRR